MKYNILVTGAAGFIGHSLCKKLLDKFSNFNIYGLDNLNSYYDVNLKKSRIVDIKHKYKSNRFKFIKCDISQFKNLEKLFKNIKIDIVINLAAQAGVRYSIVNSKKYFKSNLLGFYNLIELSKNYKVKFFYYASTSSVYGLNKNLPFDENKNTDQPSNFYAATKKCNEIIAHSYSTIFKLNTIGLRFFTVYGPWGRPDMALFKFVKNIKNKKKIDIYNFGNHKRDFTYVDDVTTSIAKLIKKNISLNKKKLTKYQIFNIGNGKKEPLKKYIKLIEKNLKLNASKNYMGLQKGDMKETYSNSSKLSKFISYKPTTKIENGIKKFVNWYNKFYKTE